MFSNWQIFKTPPGFANTNNPMEAFNKIIKAHFTNYEEHPLLTFIRIVVEYIIPFYSNNTREFLFYRVASKTVIKLAKRIDTSKLEMKGLNECIHNGAIHIHTINFNTKTCSCRWFLAFAICSHIIAACDHFNRELKGYRVSKSFVHKAKRGRKPKSLTFTDQAFRSNPMPIIPLIVDEDSRESIFIPGIQITLPILREVDPELEQEPELPARVTRSYTKKVQVRENVVKRLGRTNKPIVNETEKRKRGRPRQVASALDC
jgi:hypothetical protein